MRLRQYESYRKAYQAASKYSSPIPLASGRWYPVLFLREKVR